MAINGLYARQVQEFLASSAPLKTRKKVQQGLNVVQEALTQFGSSRLALSFNGGKDCLVMLYLILAVLDNSKTSLPTVYVRSNHTFPEVDAFVDECGSRYNLEVESITQPMKQALETYLGNHSNISAIFVGIRRADPHTVGLKSLQSTDAGWPQFMRIHPVLEWEYDDVWVFLRHLDIPYCILYDQGYTSLGSTTSTVPNPELKRADGSYKPAFELENNDMERIGRSNPNK